ncbi:MAG: patatin-like phospholipase family protein [Halarcobacter sp.]
MNLALVLSGGAARGAFHLGILAYLEDNNIEISAYSGSSIGAIIACSHASGVKAREILTIFRSDEIKETLKFNYLKKGLLKIDEKHPIFDKLLPIKKLEDIPKKVFINAYDLNSKKVFYFDKGDTHKLCLSSAALIPIFRPISYEKYNFIDGGLFDNIPIKPLENKSYDIYSIDLMPSSKKHRKRTFNPIKILKKKLFETRLKNAIYSKQHSDVYITHERLRETEMFTFKGLEETFEFGYKEASKYFT